jgi:prephenate dehydrogenase
MKLALIGVGLIGGSFARALRAAGRVDRIVGFDSRPETLARAVQLGVIDEVSASPAQAVEQADVVVIATPVGSIQEVLRMIAPRLPDAAIVTDVGSTKGSVIEGARRELGSAFERFVPGHPIAGREHSGVEFADAALFDGKVFISTPVAQTKSEAVSAVETLWQSVGCRSKRMTAEEHDTVFAAVSHLPHLLAFALIAQIADSPDAEGKFAMAGAGFRDFTRIAASSPTMWRDVCIANAEAIGSQLLHYRGLLEYLQDAIARRDAGAIERVFARNASLNR